MSNPTSQPNGAPPKHVAEPPTRHGLTGAAAVAIVSAIRAILYRVPGTADPVFFADTFDPDKEQNLESLEAIVATLEDAELAPLDWAEYQDVVLVKPDTGYRVLLDAQEKEITALRAALYETSTDISSALLWLDGMMTASDQITGARACLRKSQACRAAINEETDDRNRAHAQEVQP